MNDPQGEAVRHALHTLGFDEVVDVRVGRYLAVTLDAPAPGASARVAAMCEQLLCNGVIEDFRFTLREAGEADGVVPATAPEPP
ncbi:MAG TPA: phosphoribosylformylglycinamidine synthase subunit PurS [Candidatus Micrarchaeia archaeon]|nr:phosphoribosylformylglycinamidine synthase subunit PurS [Candidatus Micrarchaeia archaeon]